MSISISSVIKLAVEEKSSDVIITVGSPVTFIINGQLKATNSDILSYAQTKKIIYEISLPNR